MAHNGEKVLLIVTVEGLNIVKAMLVNVEILLKKEKRAIETQIPASC